jgi:hypothetical protein
VENARCFDREISPEDMQLLDEAVEKKEPMKTAPELK